MDKRTPRRKFSDARIDARRRGVAWQLTFEQWMQIWLDSGHWHERGTRRGCYCMARHGDIGPYAIGNVSIQLSIENTTFALSRAPLSSKRNRLGKGRGWTLDDGMYQVTFRRKYVGRFSTRDQAEAAYAAEIRKWFASHAPDSPFFARN